MEKNRFWWMLLLPALGIILYCELPRGTGDPLFSPVTDSETRAMADEALAAKFAGPGYFHRSERNQPEDERQWLDSHEAMKQLPRVASERHLGPAETEALRALVGKLCEPHPYRMVGGERVNLLRLNLSLDSIHWTVVSSPPERPSIPRPTEQRQ